MTEETTAGHRVVRAERGNHRTAKSWGAEAAKRMLMNNLDPKVAEHPEDLVVYGGPAKLRAAGRRMTPSSAHSTSWNRMKHCWCSPVNPSVSFARTNGPLEF